jgi:hypothetical protein
MELTLRQRILRRTVVDPTTGCWLWTGARQSRGYASLWAEGRSHLAHRLAFLLWVGPIPEGYEVDHLCRTTTCVNPDHLEPVPPHVNLQREWQAARGPRECPFSSPV